MSADKPEPIATSLAASIPPMECDHKAALELLLQTTARDMSDEQFELLVRSYREKRRLDAAKRLERERKRNETANKKLAIAARKAERLAAKSQGGGEGDAGMGE